MNFLVSFFKRYWSLILNGILLLSLIATTSYFLLETEDVVIEESTHVFENINTEAKEAKNIYVDVKGAVKKPGVYKLNEDNIINDAIKEAGGFTSKAYKNNINLSKKLKDEMVIYVYTKTEFKDLNNVNDLENCNCKDYVIDTCINNGSSVITSDDKLPNSNSTTNDDVISNSTKVNLNTATKEELLTLNGIGDAKAESIIKYREDNDGFKTIEEIKNVSGIGEAAYEKIKDSITV